MQKCSMLFMSVIYRTGLYYRWTSALPAEALNFDEQWSVT